MADFNGNKTREWKSGRTEADGTRAVGAFFNDEFNRLYDNDNHLKDTKLDRSGDTVTGDFTIEGKTTLKGDVVIEGTTTKINALDTEVSDNIVTLNKGETGNGVSKGFSGHEVDRGSSPKFIYGFDETKDDFAFGFNGSPLKYLSDLIAPIGVILPYLPGYFGGNSNNVFSQVNLDLPPNWKICDGSLLNDPESPIFNGANRYLPNLTNDRFLMGSTVLGSTGGSNDALAHTHLFTHPIAHTLIQPEFTVPAHGHAVSQQPTFNGPAHVHAWYYFVSGAGGYTYNSSGNTVAVVTGANEAGPHIDGNSGGESYVGALGTSDGAYNYTSSSGAAACTRTSDVAISNSAAIIASRTTNVTVSEHSGGSVNGVTESLINANLPKYLGTTFIMRVK